MAANGGGFFSKPSGAGRFPDVSSLAGSRPASASTAADDKVEIGRLTRDQKLKVAEAAGVAYGPDFSAEAAIRKFRKDKLIEMVAYFIFVLLFTIASMQYRDVTGTHYFLKTAKTLVLGKELESISTSSQTFEDTSTDDDFWDYLVGVVPSLLYKDETYNGQNVSRKGFWLNFNWIVAKPRLRQLRVNTIPCTVPERFKAELVTCYPPYSPDMENTTGWFGFSGTGVEYKSDAQLKSSSFGGDFFVYGGGGYVIDLPSNASLDAAKGDLQDLRDRGWTDKQTRAVMLDFAMYNPTLNLFLSVRLLWEFLEYGAIQPVSSFRVMRMGLVTTADQIVWVLDAMVYGMLMGFIVRDFRKWRQMRSRFFNDAWNLLSLFNYLVFFITLGFKVQYLNATNPYVNGVEDLGENVLDFERMGFLYMQIANWAAFNSVFVWFRTMAYLKYLNKSIADLVGTIGQAAKDCALFLVMFVMVLWAYAQAFYVSLGQDVEGFRAIDVSMFSLFRAILGDFDFDALYASNKFLGPVLFLSFQLVVFFIMLNMFLAIINKAYEDVVAAEDDDVMAIELRKTLKRFIVKVKKVLHISSKQDAPIPMWAARGVVPIDEDEEGDEESESGMGAKSAHSSSFMQPTSAHQVARGGLFGGRGGGGLSAADRAVLDTLVRTVQKLSVDVRTSSEKVDIAFAATLSKDPKSSTTQPQGPGASPDTLKGEPPERAWYRMGPAARWAGNTVSVHNEGSAENGGGVDGSPSVPIDSSKQYSTMDNFDETLNETPRLG